jgi:hypothetical protein
MSNPADLQASVFHRPMVRQSLDEEHNLHVRENVYQMGSDFSRNVCANAQD